MLRLVCSALASSIFLLPLHADMITMSSSGAFVDAVGAGSSVSGNQWSYNGADGVITFNGVSDLNGTTDLPINFGSIVLHNNSTQPNADFTADLAVTINFSPTGSLVFTDGLKLSAKSGQGSSGHGDTLILDFLGFPSALDFTGIDGTVYTVSYDGFFANTSTSEADRLNELFVLNRGETDAVAYLMGTVRRAPTPQVSPSDVAAVPEPSSVVLFGTAAIAMAAYIRRKRSTRI